MWVVAINQLRQELNLIFKNRRMEVLFLQRDEYTLIISNCSMVMFAELEYLTTKINGLDVTVEESHTSDTGFIIIFTIYPRRSMCTTSQFIQYIFVIFCSLTTVTWYCEDYRNLFGIQYQINST